MELILPDQIALDDESLALIEDVEETARRVNEYRPLPVNVVQRIQDDLIPERVYSSNAIEGNTLDLRETIKVLKTGHIDAGRKREATEARNLGEAVNRIAELVGGDDACHSPRFLLEIHRMVLRDIDDTWGGKYRGHRVMIGGATRQPPADDRVPALVERVMSRLRQPDDTNTLLRATWTHWAIARIHPFDDGNGRVARLWQDLVLFRGKLTCAILRPEDRRKYLEALGPADEGEFNPLVQLVADSVARTFDRYLAELDKDEQFKKWVIDLAGEADARSEQKRRLEYQRWSRRMEHLRREFELCAARITDASEEIRVQVRPYSLIDQQQWENIRAGQGTGRTWFFVVDFRRSGLVRRYYFFFGKHYWSDFDNEQERSTHRVCLLVSENQDSGQAVRLDQLEGCPIGLREVFVVDRNLVRKRMDFEANDVTYDRSVSPLLIAQDFMQEVILRRLT